MIEEIEIRRKTIERASRTVVQCPYCKQQHSVSSGWYFNDNPHAERDGTKIGSMYITKQLESFLKGEE